MGLMWTSTTHKLIQKVNNILIICHANTKEVQLRLGLWFATNKHIFLSCVADEHLAQTNRLHSDDTIKKKCLQSLITNIPFLALSRFTFFAAKPWLQILTELHYN